jgi:hypothetical protein
MPDVPAWLVPILQQFPIVALCLVCVREALKWADRRHAAELYRMSAAHARELADAKEMYTKLMTKLQTRIRDLEKRDADGGKT